MIILVKLLFKYQKKRDDKLDVHSHIKCTPQERVQLSIKLAISRPRASKTTENNSSQIDDAKATEIIHRPDSRRKFDGGRGEGRMEFSGIELSLPRSFLSPPSSRVSPAGSQTLSGSNDASSGNGEGGSRPEVRRIRVRTHVHTANCACKCDRRCVPRVSLRATPTPVAHK